ncbi:TVG1262718 [Thermoplasma volcanium GSS1]|uniref:TVG1262718 protein n=1 Tax=Thermoplasma volcanium (strain ATCC 51530 / DSM 4299 / JCM 9571 / NBRC 15438 / GSS1) TaxID=273116 RepID=Q979D5_THEVO|nr:MarR family transcriptional regulator [Thermoplasma volcanium]BAB60368.1 TVG1262718 [Thermoplasma volcanium GSS1]
MNSKLDDGDARYDNSRLILFAVIAVFSIIVLSITSSMMVMTIEIGYKINALEYLEYFIVILVNALMLGLSLNMIFKRYRFVVYPKLAAGIENTVSGNLLLKDNEKLIVSILEKHGGIVLQNVLVRESGLSAPTVSRILFSLENYGLIERQRKGMTNEIRLKVDNIKF